jgi:peroxiredoxin
LKAVARADDIYALPPDLPAPEDDGAAAHLPGMNIPPVALPSTAGGEVRLDVLPGRTVLFCYPRTGRPDQELPPGWDAIPGARGCTPEACGFRDRHEQFADAGARVLALSTQDTDYQREMAGRLELPFEVVSDAELRLVQALRLPTFEVDGMTLVKRLTLIINDGHIERVFYPVFPPDTHAGEVLDWLRQHA